MSAVLDRIKALLQILHPVQQLLDLPPHCGVVRMRSASKPDVDSAEREAAELAGWTVVVGSLVRFGTTSRIRRKGTSAKSSETFIAGDLLSRDTASIALQPRNQCR
jgi:hypothetical protein